MGLAVVSGGGTGIGAATARGLAQDGFDVLIVGRRPEMLAALASTVPMETVTADLTVPEDVARVADAVGDRTVDVLVNNAGGYLAEDGAGLADWWRRTFDSNVLTAVLLTEALLPGLARPGGRVILLSSIAAQRGGAGPYSAAKAALHGWGFDLAGRLGPDGITVNVLSPGYVTDTEFFGDRMTPDGHARRVAQTLVGRAGEPVDIADTIRWLVRAGYVTGQVIGVNGGSVLGR